MGCKVSNSQYNNEPENLKIYFYDIEYLSEGNVNVLVRKLHLAKHYQLLFNLDFASLI